MPPEPDGPKPDAPLADALVMTVGGLSPTLATVATGLKQAERRHIEATQTLLTPGLTAPADSAEFAQAASAVGVDGLAKALQAQFEALAATKALSLVAAIEQDNVKKTLDVLA